jgi:hypothetical protein
LTLPVGVEFPKLAIMTCGGPTCWARRRDSTGLDRRQADSAAPQRWPAE